MTLHETAEFGKKFGIGTGIGIGAIIVLVILFNVGIFIKNMLLPPTIAPANQKLGKLPPVEFPQSNVDGSFTYTVNTVDGALPTDLPDRVIVYPMVVPKPNLNNLQTIKTRVASLGFVDTTGNVLPEISRGGSLYEWDEPTGLQRKMIYDNVTFNFSLTSNYLTSLDVLNGRHIQDQNAAFSTAQSFLSSIDSLPADLDFNLTTDPDPANSYTVVPELYTIDSTGEKIKTTSLQDTKVIRVNFYQKAIEYSLTAGAGGELSNFKNFDLKIPIMYPNPPYSTMDLYVASAADQAQVMEGSYAYQGVDTSTNSTPEELATYPIKPAEQAFQELQNGNGYIAGYAGSSSEISIKKVYLGYYIGETTQQYLMPVLVFEGEEGFYGYVSAVANESIQ